MKKLFALAAIVGVGYVLWKVLQDDDERDLWAEVTDSLDGLTD